MSALPKSPAFLFLNLFLAAVIAGLPSCAAEEDTQSCWPEITSEAKPWTRMWWMGSAVNKDDLSMTLREYAEAGIGGVEITPIYGVKGMEHRYIDFLSPEWMEMLRFTIEEAGRHGMGVDINLGTGWPYGGPWITPEYGAKRLVIRRFPDDGSMYPGNREVSISPLRRAGDTLVAIYAVSENGDRTDLSEMTGANGTVTWMPGNGRWQIYAAVSENTRQLVKRAAPGGEGLTVDPFAREALEFYLERFDHAFGPDVPRIRSMFDDSYEVYAASFTPSFFEHFEKRRGYDVRPYLRELYSSTGSDSVIRIQADYRETLSDLLLEEFTVPWDEWISDKGSESRLQAHGSPGNLLDLYAVAGIPEGETFGSNIFPIRGFRKHTDDTRNPPPDPLMMKFASSAGNTQGKKLVSSETFTWAGEHFMVSLAELKPEMEEILLAGVNHIFFHGSSFIPEDAPWPGWLFYASVQFNPRNSFWPHLSGMNQYIARCQSILQSTAPDNELLVYWPVHDIWHRTGNLDMLLTVHNTGDWLLPSEFYRTVRSLTGTGYSADYISGRQLAQSAAGENGIVTAPGALPYRALVVPCTGFMPEADLDNIIRLAEEGATIIFACMPSDVPGFHDPEKRREDMTLTLNNMMFEDVSAGLAEYNTGKGSVLLAKGTEGFPADSAGLVHALEYKGIYRETLGDRGLKFTRRDHGNGKYYYIVNHTSRDIDTIVTINSTRRTVLLLDPQNGRMGTAAAPAMNPATGNNPVETASVRLQVPSGGALFVKTTDSSYAGTPAWDYFVPAGESILYGQEWTLSFTRGGPVLPGKRLLDEPGLWTGLPGDEMQHFSGSAEYATEFYIDRLTHDEYLLCLGDVRESARVRINGQDAGTAWSNPFSLKVGQHLREGTNILKIEVANLMANRIRYMDREEIEWRVFHDINFVSLFYTPFDASGQEALESGLGGPVRLLPLARD